MTLWCGKCLCKIHTETTATTTTPSQNPEHRENSKKNANTQMAHGECVLGRNDEPSYHRSGAFYSLHRSCSALTLWHPSRRTHPGLVRLVHISVTFCLSMPPFSIPKAIMCGVRHPCSEAMLSFLFGSYDGWRCICLYVY